jgi:hypothetical protein
MEQIALGKISAKFITVSMICVLFHLALPKQASSPPQGNSVEAIGLSHFTKTFIHDEI